LALLVAYFRNRVGLSLESFLYREAFSIMSFIAGLIGGTHFPLANRLLLQEQTQVGRTAGLIYGVDLLGSFIGCLMIGLVLIPVAGILQTLIILALVNLTAVMPLLGTARRAKSLINS